VVMSGAHGLTRRPGSRYLSIGMPLDMDTWRNGTGPEWLDRHVSPNPPVNGPTALGGSSLVLRRTTTRSGNSTFRPGLSFTFGPGDPVLVEKPFGVRELHVFAEGIILNGLNLTAFCKDTGYDTVERSTVHDPKGCPVASHVENDVDVRIGESTKWSHVIMTDDAHPSKTVLLARPNGSCELRVNAPLFLNGDDISACVRAATLAMQTNAPVVNNVAHYEGTVTLSFHIGAPHGTYSSNESHTSQDAESRRLSTHVLVSTSVLQEVEAQVLDVMVALGATVTAADITSVLTNHVSSSRIDVTIVIPQMEDNDFVQIANTTVHSEEFVRDIEAVVGENVAVVSVVFDVVSVHLSPVASPPTPSSVTAGSPPATPPPGVVWWNGEGGEWTDTSIWNGGSVRNASEVILCPTEGSNGTIFVPNGSSTTGNVTICSRVGNDHEILVITGDLCMGVGCA
jgi:hypothetical protein